MTSYSLWSPPLWPHTQELPLLICVLTFSPEKLEERKSISEIVRGWSLYISHCSHKGKNSVHGGFADFPAGIKWCWVEMTKQKEASHHGQNILATDTWNLIWSPTLRMMTTQKQAYVWWVEQWVGQSTDDDAETSLEEFLGSDKAEFLCAPLKHCAALKDLTLRAAQRFDIASRSKIWYCTPLKHCAALKYLTLRGVKSSSIARHSKMTSNPRLALLQVCKLVKLYLEQPIKTGGPSTGSYIIRLVSSFNILSISGNFRHLQVLQDNIGSILADCACLY